SRELTEEQENIPKIQTTVCPVGQTRCLVKAWQQCDGTTFVTKKLCNLQEVCDVEKGCIPRAEKIVPTQRGVSKDFFYWRYKECRIGQIQCNKRFIRQCINNRWVDNICQEGEYCHPTKGCIQKTGLTRLKQRELAIPREPKVPLLQLH
ncbi:hypothetical protein HY485_01620, partial [Candidatus Woesearchaeota archaeon]|nr:hypothetical protein [Candidatus Woesearchaeota archaeon]